MCTDAKFDKILAYEQLRGKIVCYQDGYGPDCGTKMGKLTEVGLDPKTNTLVACIETPVTILGVTVSNSEKKIPLNCIISRPTPGSVSKPKINQNNQSRKSRCSKYGESFQFGQHRYLRSTVREFKVGEEVVWKRKKSNPFEPPLIGKVEFIGECFAELGPQIFIAVVKFDQATNHLGGYIQTEPRNRNVIRVHELERLDRWLYQQEERMSLEANNDTDNCLLNHVDNGKEVPTANLIEF